MIRATFAVYASRVTQDYDLLTPDEVRKEIRKHGPTAHLIHHEHITPAQFCQAPLHHGHGVLHSSEMNFKNNRKKK